MRSYISEQCIVFWKTKEQYGGLSNMAGGFPVVVNGLRISTVEALYQACKFSDYPRIQQAIFDQSSPIFAKKVTKPHQDKIRANWENEKIQIMRWCLRVKLYQNWDKFSELLKSTGNKSIVEYSDKDNFWGAMPVGDGVLEGTNALGRLLMQLREDMKRPNGFSESSVVPPFRNLKILGRGIQPIEKISGEPQGSFEF
ncbi:NADAR family protein [Bdellovibrio sp. NC01]|uniref:NADAR family protein n=1 Tax=Bdellovibrio sp. NC01 TaxID=2220073 RepID=UPI00115732B7|nr:NADAR family protein [Bdellovibrio sp. NC01]